MPPPVQSEPARRAVEGPLAALLLSAFLSLSLPAQTLETERWPLPMRVDQQQVPTRMLIEMSFERLETAYPQFAPQDDPDKEAMSDFVESILAGEIDQALELTDEPPGTARENARGLLEAFNSLLDGQADDLELDRVVHQGSDRLLLWSIPLDEQQRHYRSFRFVRGGDGQLLYEGIGTEPVSSLITNALQVSQNAGPDPRQPDELEYEYTVPGTDDSPVVMRFDGELLDINAFSAQAETGNEIVDFYLAAIDALANGTAAQHAEYYSEYSQGRYLEWAATQGTEAYEAYRADMIDFGARVVFALDAAPMHLLFYLPENVNVQGNPLQFASIYDDPENGPRLTNFYIEGLTATFLKRREYFEEPFLRPLLAESALIDEQGGPVATIVSADETELPDPDDYALRPDELDPEPDAAPEVDSIEDLASDPPIWPWILGGVLVIALIALALRWRNRNDSKK